jgi:hypothetical protein
MPETKNRDTADIVDDAATQEDLASAGFSPLLMMGA